MIKNVIINHQIEIIIKEVPIKLINIMKSDLTISNPAYINAEKCGRTTHGIPKKIYLYEEQDERICFPRGYGKQMQERFKENDIPVQWGDERLTLDPVDFGSKIALRDYQLPAVEQLIKAKQGGISAPCGSGKTLILLETIARIGQPAIWITHTKELAEQAIERATEFLHLTRSEIGIIGSGQCKIGEKLTVALVQTLAKVDLSEIKDKFGLVAIDEAHHLGATMFFHPVGQFPARYRLWASATPERADGLTKMVYASAGPIVHEVERVQLPTIDPIVEVVETGFSGVDDGYSQLISRLTEDHDRNKLITRLIANESDGHYSLVIGDRIEHLLVLKDWLENLDAGYRVEVLHGDLPKRERTAIMERARSKEIDVLFATQLAREGLDLPFLDRLFLVTPKRAKGAIEQEIGRIMRPAEGKKDAKVFDLWDSRSPMIRGQFWARKEVYSKLKLHVIMPNNHLKLKGIAL